MTKLKSLIVSNFTKHFQYIPFIINSWQPLKRNQLEVNDPLKTFWTRKKKESLYDENVLNAISRDPSPDHHQYILHKRSFDIDRIAFVQLSPVSISSRKVTYLSGTCSSIKLAYERGMLARKGKVRRRRSFVARAEMRFRFYSLPSSVNLREIYPRTFDRFAFPAWHVR